MIIFFFGRDALGENSGMGAGTLENKTLTNIGTDLWDVTAPEKNIFLKSKFVHIWWSSNIKHYQIGFYHIISEST